MLRLWNTVIDEIMDVDFDVNPLNDSYWFELQTPTTRGLSLHPKPQAKHEAYVYYWIDVIVQQNALTICLNRSASADFLESKKFEDEILFGIVIEDAQTIRNKLTSEIIAETDGIYEKVEFLQRTLRMLHIMPSVNDKTI